MQLHLICNSKAALPPESVTADADGAGPRLWAREEAGVGSHVADCAEMECAHLPPGGYHPSGKGHGPSAGISGPGRGMGTRKRGRGCP